MTAVLKDDVCDWCARPIALIKTGVNTYKWVSNPSDRGSWRCGGDQNFPLRSHAPRTLADVS